MKALVYQKYGAPEVVQFREIDRPVPVGSEYLIEVHYSTVNRTDCGFRSAEYFISRFWSGLLKPRNQILGCEFSGVVVQTGPECTSFKIGDRVMGFDDKYFGGHAEYKLAHENTAVALIPENVNFREAAALTEGAHYALCDIRAARVQSGQEVMVYGATGAIGSAAVQILKSMNVFVTAVCGTKHVEIVKQLGADVVIDYQTENYAAISGKFDFIFDAVGKSSFKICKKLLKPAGIYISTELGKNGANVWNALLGKWHNKKKTLFPIPTVSAEDIQYLANLAAAGKLKPLADRDYNPDEIHEAYRYAESGQKLGNIFIRWK